MNLPSSVELPGEAEAPNLNSPAFLAWDSCSHSEGWCVLGLHDLVMQRVFLQELSHLRSEPTCQFFNAYTNRSFACFLRKYFPNVTCGHAWCCVRIKLESLGKTAQSLLRCKGVVDDGYSSTAELLIL